MTSSVDSQWIPKTQAELDADFWCWVDKENRMPAGTHTVGGSCSEDGQWALRAAHWSRSEDPERLKMSQAYDAVMLARDDYERGVRRAPGKVMDDDAKNV